MNKEVEAELKAKLKQLPMPEKIKCCALYKHLQDVYAAQTDCDNKNRKIIYNFSKDFGPLLDEVNDIANGKALTDEMLEGKEEFFKPEELEAKEFMNEKPLEEYYLKMLKKGSVIAEYIKSADEPILKHLTKIESEVFEDKDDYKLKFHFSENEHFTNDVLTVHVVIDGDEEELGEATEIISDKINWNEGKNITEKTITKKQKNKRTGQARTVTKVQKQDSFFRMFESRKREDDDEDNEDDDEAQDEFSIWEEIIGTIKENYHYAGPSFFGVEIPELEIIEDDDEDDDDYEDEEEDAPKGKKKAKKDDPKAEECKQN